MPGKGKIFVISGPSGSGKTTLLENLLNSRALKKKLVRSISFTTRPQRSREKDKRDYFFISAKAFKAKRKAKKILEWTKYLGYYYGTSKEFVESRFRKGKNLVLCLDARGAMSLRRLYPKNIVTIFVKPPSLEELKKRISKRCNKTKEEEIRRRLKIAKSEMQAADGYDYSLVNKELRKTTVELKRIVLEEAMS
jgi:guanylate kinase